jgi:ubiquitin C-terminal hydrolase
MFEYNSELVPRNQNGLNNSGATCYLNSLIQALLSCSQFNKIILDSKDTLEKTDIGRHLYNVVYSSINNLNNFGMSSINLQRQLVMSRKINPGQQCSIEAVNAIFDTINLKKIDNLFTHRYRCCVICKKCDKDSYINKIKDNHSIVDECMFVKISKPIDSIEQFKKYLHSHIDQLGVNCKECNTELVRLYYLTMLPSIIIVAFNKYSNPKPKHIYPHEFNIKSSTPNKLMNYIQVAQIEHHGIFNANGGGGHYIARALRNGKVYLFNDNSVQESQFNITENAYILIYHFNKLIDNVDS